jgi:hypothetical protein
MIFFIAGLIIGLIIGLVSGYQLCMYQLTQKKVDARIQQYNQRWLKQRAKIPSCSMCPSIADMGYCMVKGKPGTKVYWCKVHFLQTHQPTGKPNGWTCEHRLGQVLEQEKMICGWCGKQYKLGAGFLLPATVNPIKDKHAIYAFQCNACALKELAEEQKQATT